MTKDLALGAHGVAAPLGALAAEIYQRFNHTSADGDFSAVITDIRARVDGAPTA